MPLPQELAPEPLLAPEAYPLDAELLPEEYVLGKDDSVELRNFSEAYRAVGPNQEPITNPDSPVQVDGHHALTLRLGMEGASIDAKIVDVRDSPVIAGNYRNGLIRDVGTEHGRPMLRAGDFMLVLPSKDGQADEVHGLVPGASPREIGRGQQLIEQNGARVLLPRAGSLAEGLLPKTVSGDHCAVGLNQDGSLLVSNHAPTNDTVLKQPEAAVSAEAEDPRLANMLRRLPASLDPKVFLHNLGMMRGPGAPMEALLDSESIGGNAGTVEIDGARHLCGTANGFFDEQRGTIEAFENFQNVPHLVGAFKEFRMRVAMDEMRKLRDDPDNFRGFFRIVGMGEAGQRLYEPPALEDARTPLEASAAAFNELNA